MSANDNKTTRCYSSKVGNDPTVSDNATLTSSFSMPVKTYRQIDLIKSITSNKSRGSVVEAAVQFYLNYINSPKYIADLQTKIQTLNAGD